MFSQSGVNLDDQSEQTFQSLGYSDTDKLVFKWLRKADAELKTECGAILAYVPTPAPEVHNIVCALAQCVQYDFGGEGPLGIIVQH